MKIVKNFVLVIIFLLLIASQASANDPSIEIFNKDGSQLSISKDEANSILSALPSVDKIIANFKESALGGTNLFIQFRLKDGTWKRTAAGINGNAPVSWHISDLIKNELPLK